ncbi:SDR family NAD(P)-dependent oxidoreductase [Streptomyces sp. R44]|uniref:SDR family NAD(P)-dependent oxidoreductase n=1 Tax=Streptomyces sp. R44 TaxID=3238633 RepID=A0AB39SL44_9ACTN
MAGGKVLVVGATGAVGGLASEILAHRGASVALAGRDASRLTERSIPLGGCPCLPFDAYDLEGCAALAPRAAQALGGLDALIIAIGVAGFGRAEEVTNAAAEHLLAVNALAPMAVARGALGVMAAGSTIAVVTGAIVEKPMRGMADYTASKAALAAWLGVVRREQRTRGIAVVDVRMPHLDTGFADRAVIGKAPRLPTGLDAYAAVEELVVQPILAGAA